MFIAIILIFTSVAVFLLRPYRKRRNFQAGDHVLVTGGSSGIGKAVALKVIQQGANVTLVARNQTRLEEAREELLKFAQNLDKQKVLTFSIDVGHDFGPVEKMVMQAEEEGGPITMLVNCAGTSVSHRFEETPMEDFRQMIEINYLGSVYVTRAVLPGMKARHCGRIVLTSSLAGLFGIYGYTAYSASKFALLGLAESLQMEVKPYNIHVTIAFPPDTDTPGLAQEMLTKPLETKQISESGGLFSAAEVAQKMINDSMADSFVSTIGMEGWLLQTLCSGMMPVSSITELLSQVMTMGLFRLVSAVFLMKCNRTVRSCAQLREQSKKME